MFGIEYTRTMEREVRMFVNALSTLLLTEGNSECCIVTENSDWKGDPPIVWRMNREMLERFEARESI